MNISDREELGRLKFKFEKLQRENQDLKDNLTSQKMIIKSEVQFNHDQKQMIESLKLQTQTFAEVIDQYSKRIIQYRNYIDILLTKND